MQAAMRPTTAETKRISSVSWGSIDADVAAAAVPSDKARPFVPPWLVASMLLRLGLGCCDDDVGQRNADLGVLVATGLDGNVDEPRDGGHGGVC